MAGIEPATPCLQSVNQAIAIECDRLQSCFVFLMFRGSFPASQFQLSAMVYYHGVHQVVHQLFAAQPCLVAAKLMRARIVALRAQQCD